MAEQTATSASTAFQTVTTWTPASNGGTPDTFTAVQLGRRPYSMMAQVSGTFGASASVAIHGSVDGTNYYALKDRSNTAIAITAAGLANISDAPLYIKPVLTNGDGSTAVVVKLLTWHDSN